MSEKITKKLILEKYESYEELPSKIKAWITAKAKKEGKDVKMVHAGYKATFKRFQNQTTITIIKEECGHMGGVNSATPIHHIIKARNPKVLANKIGEIYDEILESLDEESHAYKGFVKNKEFNISKLIEIRKSIDIDGVTLEIISDSDYVTIR